jgi:DNA-binding LytR/AlgR family response regulator
MFLIAISDNDTISRTNLSYIVEAFFRRETIPCRIMEFQSGDDLLESTIAYNIVFLDMDENGQETGRKLHLLCSKTKIIYTIKSLKYGIHTLNSVHPFALIAKPISTETVEFQLNEVLRVDKVERDVVENYAIVKFNVLDKTKDGLTISKRKSFNVHDIYYFEYVNRKIRIKLRENDYYFTGKMQDVAEQMRTYSFYSCHQSFLANLRYIVSVKGYEVYLENMERLPLSQKRSADFRRKLNLFISDNI